jgi:hypothetical protein
MYDAVTASRNPGSGDGCVAVRPADAVVGMGWRVQLASGEQEVRRICFCESNCNEYRLSFRRKNQFLCCIGNWPYGRSCRTLITKKLNIIITITVIIVSLRSYMSPDNTVCCRLFPAFFLTLASPVAGDRFWNTLLCNKGTRGHFWNAPCGMGKGCHCSGALLKQLSQHRT